MVVVIFDFIELCMTDCFVVDRMELTLHQVDFYFLSHWHYKLTTWDNENNNKNKLIQLLWDLIKT